MKKLKNEKGSIAVLVAITLFFFIAILGATYTAMYAMQKSQLESDLQIKRSYENDVDNVDRIYEDLINSGNYREYQDPSGANAPVLKTGMEAIVYDKGTDTWVAPARDSDWYAYIDQTGHTTNGTTGNIGTSKWANAKVTVNGVESYFVWVPRYEYKIDSTNQKMDVRFIPVTQTIADSGYIIHPAFIDDSSTTFANGGWDSELPGIWVAKYEMSRTDAVGTTEGIATTFKSVPNVTSARSIMIGNMYTYSLAYNTNLESHMMKNSEWGAVAYLTHSQYGRNGTEVTINNNSSYLTGNAGETVSASSSSTTNAYNTAKGQLASSTGNIYGIYDLSGGAYEYVAAWDTLSTSTSVSSYGSSFAIKNGPSTRYATAYSNGTSSYAATQAMAKIGDATYEVYAGSNKAWNSDVSNFVYSNDPFFLRGGNCYSASSAGVFCAYFYGGFSYGYYGFRVCLAVK